MSMPAVIVIGAGPGGLAAAHHLAASGQVDVVLVQPEGRANYLPGILPTLLSVRPASDYRHPIASRAIQTHPGEVVALESGRVRLADGAALPADAIIAAPGLHTAATAIPAGPRTFAAWELASADAARAAVKRLDSGRVVVAIASLPYRCPPAPYGLAMSLAALFRQHNRAIEVSLTTPEARPLQTLGERVSAFLEQLAHDAGIVLHTSFQPDLAASRDGLLVTSDGRQLPYDLGLIVPPHTRPSFLSALPGSGPLVQVDAHQRTVIPNVWAVGDVTATPLPRAAGVAEAQGRTAADDVLAALGLSQPRPPHPPAPSCYVWTSPSTAARILIEFPNGLPPAGSPSITLDPPSPALFADALAARDRWLAQLAPGHPS
jgi:sulfide:quinone oxidoreductase